MVGVTINRSSSTVRNPCGARSSTTQSWSGKGSNEGLLNGLSNTPSGRFGHTGIEGCAVAPADGKHTFGEPEVTVSDWKGQTFQFEQRLIASPFGHAVEVTEAMLIAPLPPLPTIRIAPGDGHEVVEDLIVQCVLERLGNGGRGEGDAGGGDDGRVHASMVVVDG